MTAHEQNTVPATCIIAACCDWTRSVVCQSVCPSVCHVPVSCKNAEWIEVPFGLDILGDWRNIEGPNLPMASVGEWEKFCPL